MSKRFLFYFLILFPGFLNAQKVWTLEECIQHANENNLEIKQAEINKEVAERNLFQSKGNLIPTVNASVNNNYNYGRNIDPFTNQFTNNQVRSNNFSVFSSVTLFNGFQIQNQIRQSKFEVLAAQYDVELIKNNTALNITSIYLQILFNIELVEITTTQLELTKAQLDRMKKLVAAGKFSPVTLPDLEAQLASEEVRQVSAQNQLKLSYLSLAQLMNLNPEEEFEVLKPALITVPDTSVFSNTNEVYEKALTTQPQIKSADYRRLSSEKSYDIARGRISPRLTLNGSIGSLYSSTSQRVVGFQVTGVELIGLTTANDSVFAPTGQSIRENKTFNDQFNDNLNKFVGFTLTVPILNNFQVRTSISRARLGIQQAELNLQIQKRDLHRSVVAAHVDAVNAKRRMDASEAAVRASQEALRNAEKRMEVGQINSFDYIQVKNRLTQSQSDLVQAKYDFVFRSKILDFYRGVPLKL